MIRAYDGLAVLDAKGQKVGTVEQTYADEHGRLRFLKVKMGGLLATHRLVPAEPLQLTDGGLRVPYSTATIKGSFDASKAADTLQGIPVDQISAFYRRGLNKQVAAGMQESIEPGLVREQRTADKQSGQNPALQQAREGKEQTLKDTAIAFFQKVMKDNIGMLASVVSWSVLTSVVPIMLGLLAISGFVLRNNPSAQASVISHLSAALQGALTTKDIQSIVRASTQHAGLLGIVGFLSILWGGSNVGGSFSTAFQAIFEVNGRNFIVEKLIDIGMIFIFAILMVVIIAATSAAAIVGRLLNNVPIPGGTTFAIGVVIGVVAAFLLFSAIYVVFPNTEPRFKFQNVWKGAIVSAVLFEILSFIWPIYAHFAHFSRYGAVLFPILLLTAWIYFFSMILMVGAEVVAFASIREANRQDWSIGPSPTESVPQHEVLRGSQESHRTS